MNIPQLPTDSLYKFMALAGVIITLASVFIPGYLLFEIGRQLITAETEMEVLKEKDRLFQAESRDFDREGEDLRRDIENLEKKRTPTQKDLHALHAKHAMFKKQYTELRAKQTENAVNAALTAGKIREIDRLAQWGKRSILAMTVGALLGPILAFAGFGLWYRRVQVHQDALLRKQVQESKT